MASGPLVRPPTSRGQPRQPLQDASNRQNLLSVSQPDRASVNATLSPLAEHHHVSLQRNPNHLKDSSAAPASENREYKRIVEIVAQEQQDSKRSSIISTSTNSTPGTGRQRKRFIGPWQLGVDLGKGASGRVRKAKHVQTNQLAAVKIVNKSAAQKLSSESVANMDAILSRRPGPKDHRDLPFGIEREICIMKIIEHPNIVKLFDVWENRGELYLVLEYIDGGELYDHVINQGYLNEKEAVRIFRQIISGLAYCHEFKLCHRDIKPENILLDGKKNVKLADFGMAAIQHDKWLTTSCGSPEYAAPEIHLGRRYKGSLTDVWSCGVVLFVMLTGLLPFESPRNGGRGPLRSSDRGIVQAQLYFPDQISQKAQDFLERILEYEPQDRISIRRMWMHPLLTQYERVARLPENRETWIGGPPEALTASDCGERIMRINDIDMDLLRSLCTLWHSTNQQGLVDALLSPLANYEKVIYRNLARHKAEQEECFEGAMIELSSSDYHHMRSPVRRTTTRASMQKSGTKRKRSQYSISSDNPRQYRASSRALSEAGTEQSYDPFRPSRHKFTNPDAAYANITVLRGSSKGTKYSGKFSNASSSIRHPALTRIQREDSYQLPGPRHTDAHGNGSDQRRSWITVDYTSSKVSMASSMGSSRQYRRSASYKRPVSFNHFHRQSSTADSSPPPRPEAPGPMSANQRYLSDRLSSTPNMMSQRMSMSPQLSPSPKLRSRKEALRHSYADDSGRSEKRRSVNWKEEARLVSRELERFCDEAFNERSSSPDPTHDGQKEKNKSSTRDNKAKYDPKTLRDMYNERPLPEPPVSEPLTSQTLRELAKTRQKLVEGAKGLDTEQLNDIIADFDRLLLMQANTARKHAQDYDRRVITAPEPRNVESLGLSPVKEEDEDHGRRQGSTVDDHRHVSEPTYDSQGNYTGSPTRRRWGKDNPTIRLVVKNPDPLYPPPLVIRKKSSGTSLLTTAAQQANVTKAPPTKEGVSQPAPTMKKKSSITSLKESAAQVADGSFFKARFNKSTPSLLTKEEFTVRPVSSSSYNRRSTGLDMMESDLTPIEEDENKENRDPIATQRYSGDSKTKSWFRRSTGSQKSGDFDKKPIVPLKDEHSVLDFESKRLSAHLPPAEDIFSEEIVFRETRKEKPGGTNRFLRFLGLGDGRDRRASDMALLDRDQDDDGDSFAPSTFYQRSSNRTPSLPNGSALNLLNTKTPHFNIPDPPVRLPTYNQPQNWFTRFFNVKPAKRIIGMQVPKLRAMKEIRGVLRDWRRYGMRDILVDKAAGIIHCKVSTENTLGIKPVEIAIEIYTVLSKGRKAGLCIARVSQEKGAKSSFDKVAKTLLDVLKGRELVVTDKKQAKEMRKTLNEWENYRS